MILASMVFVWVGLAMMYTFALCWAASGPMPKPDPCWADARRDQRETSRGEQETPGSVLD